MAIDCSGDLKFNSGYGSAGTAYGCRAWVNFNGYGTLSIRGDGNVSSLTDNASADYTINFSTSMPDVNYCAVFGFSEHDAGSANYVLGIKTDAPEGPAFTYSTSALRVLAQNGSGGNEELSYNCVAIFR